MIAVWDRKQGKMIEERVYGDFFLSLCYGNAPGRFVTGALFTSKTLSRLYGALQSSARSRRKIDPFIRDFSIPMEEFEGEGTYASFNEFFIRKFRPGARAIESDPRRMPAIAEGRYLCFENADAMLRFPLKGACVTTDELLDAGGASIEPAVLRAFRGGPLAIARLCPVDYHRFHFPDDGQVLSRYRVPGTLHSVNPRALASITRLFRINEREVTILETKNFGMLAYVEVGAMMVGRIVQSHPSVLAGAGPFRRGEEKGYFLFGASTVILLGEPGRWAFDADLVKRSETGVETLLRLGEGLAGVPRG